MTTSSELLDAFCNGNERNKQTNRQIDSKNLENFFVKKNTNQSTIQLASAIQFGFRGLACKPSMHKTHKHKHTTEMDRILEKMLGFSTRKDLFDE